MGFYLAKGQLISKCPLGVFLVCTSIMDRQLLHQKVCQIILVIKTNTGEFCCLQDKMWIKMPK